jgi:bifunctional enzyme CysN/CysC
VSVVWHHGELSRQDRWEATGIAGATVWLTGLSGSGKSTVAYALERTLVEAGRPAYVLDGDNLRHGLTVDLTFTDEDRAENVRRVGHVAALLADAGVVAIAPVISPFRSGRAAARAASEALGVRFLEVFMDTPLAECERRDPKGLYAGARAGRVRGLTGVDAPYEAPMTADLVLTPADGDVRAQAARILPLLG